ncbi:hypothetical protein [Lentzea cavernae]|uniref:Uncharacterized protein n=1 Tax=Lentzea cavernae TaxID=2020703 RepID=A0ABQ3MT76_9PSEU|nr:hypothetical protein [Lentzea cavernae]GHH59812.1 hypothetical protein GCM10017774_83220 [Lentzea cavernae]
MPANGNRSLDRLLRTFRGHIRTHNLPRPDRLVIFTKTRSVHAEFTSGLPVDRFAAVLSWTATLHHLNIGLTFDGRDELRLAATGRSGSGPAIGLACSAPVLDLGGTVEHFDQPSPLPNRFAFLPGLPMLFYGKSDYATFDQLTGLVAHARTVAASENVAADRALGVVA